MGDRVRIKPDQPPSAQMALRLDSSTQMTHQSTNQGNLDVTDNALGFDTLSSVGGMQGM